MPIEIRKRKVKRVIEESWFYYICDECGLEASHQIECLGWKTIKIYNGNTQNIGKKIVLCESCFKETGL